MLMPMMFSFFFEVISLLLSLKSGRAARARSSVMLLDGKRNEPISDLPNAQPNKSVWIPYTYDRVVPGCKANLRRFGAYDSRNNVEAGAEL